MKNSLLLSIFILISFPILAQIELEDKLIGTWKVLEVRYISEGFDDLDEKETEEVKAALEAFEGSQFHFDIDNSFHFDIEYPDLNNQELKWELNKLKNRIIIESAIDLKNGIYLEIEYLEKGEDLFFNILDTPIIMRLRKHPNN
ncbi:hypothetical protein [Arcticibacterium luteifluviistationis]|uniref:Lipocalin-like domain-containing protein n=1 Tax=Arcticibacterium luteifluviistationis TaxID=1784714 RepID=A0A2Z4G6X7_9BACT|nr:hypothetical protein [Arcticibacterium luteifluviistationis]AWV96916.1 hypothetical protein DJ013_01475 [Arcticibacterium luteifluviistationis]